jgi:hypothetical protein
MQAVERNPRVYLRKMAKITSQTLFVDKVNPEATSQIEPSKNGWRKRNPSRELGRKLPLASKQGWELPSAMEGLTSGRDETDCLMLQMTIYEVTLP